MKRCSLLLIILLVGIKSINAQQLIKRDISTSGCQAYFFCNPGAFEKSYSPDSSIVYTGSCRVADSLEYGLIVIRFKETVPEPLVAENLMISYMDYLKESFQIKSAVGYGKGHTMPSHAAARGVIDFWKDKDGHEWKVKGWTDGAVLSFLYVMSLTGALPNSTKTDIYLDGFRFH